MHTIYTKIAAKVKIRILTKWDQKEFLVKISATDLIQELPSELRSIDRMYWSIDRKSIDRTYIRSIEYSKFCRARNRNRNRIENLFFFFFLLFGTTQKLIDSNMKQKTTQIFN
jgi:hypothetical protein